MTARIRAICSLFIAVLASHCVPAANGDAVAIIPRPMEIKPAEGEWKPPANVLIGVELADDETRAIARQLAELFPGATQIDLPGGGGSRASECTIYLKLSPISLNLGDDAYVLEIGAKGISLIGSDAAGLFHGVQTIRQLMFDAKGGALPAMQIRDRPRFAHRGLLLDCCRHFMSKEFVKRYIDLMAYHKLNVLHWHLTDDQGWRIEIKRYPKLTEVGAWRKATRPSETPVDAQGRYGGYYTQDDIREIVAYAKARYVMIVPEIEMPGHSMAALASYPELACTAKPFEVATQWGVYDDVFCAGDDLVFAFIENVLTEVMDLFDSPYIHIGGDECPKTRWKECPKCQARKRALELKDENELQSFFIRRVGVFLAMHGRRLIGWDEILEGGLPPTVIVQCWRGMDYAVAAVRNHDDVIVSPTSHCYLDYWQNNLPGEPTDRGFISLEKTYSLEPVSPELTPPQARRVIGVEGNMWTEHAPPALVDRQVFPRLCAIAEVGWSPAERDWVDFSRRMTAHYARLDQMKVAYYIAPPRLLTPELTFVDAIDVTFEPDAQAEIRYALDDAPVTAESTLFKTPLHLAESKTLRTRRFLPNGRGSDELIFPFRKLIAKEPAAVTQTQPGLHCDVFAGEFNRTTWFEGATAANSIDGASPDLSQRGGDERFGVRYRGYFDAPREGLYRFYLKADDAARVIVGDETVVTASWSTAEQKGVVLLKPGKHPITIEMWQIAGPYAFELSVEPPNGQREPISKAGLSH